MVPVEGNRMRLDGGAMFGNCPKILWDKWLKADGKNRVELACRSLLIEKEGKYTLIDVGIGPFFEPKLKERYGVEENRHLLLENLAKLGVAEEAIDRVILTHLHFDHAGGLLPPFGAEERLLFPNATIYVGKEHWEHATNPPEREKASYIPRLHRLLESSGRLKFIDENFDGMHFSTLYGHTRGLLLIFIEGERPLIVVSDLIPGLSWGNSSLAMGYDRFPEQTCREKKVLMDIAKEKNALIFFTHDPVSAFGEFTDAGLVPIKF